MLTEASSCLDVVVERSARHALEALVRGSVLEPAGPEVPPMSPVLLCALLAIAALVAAMCGGGGV